jgi:hypothetical protein
MKKAGKFLAILVLLLALAGAGWVYFYFTGAAERVIEQAGSEALGVPVKVKDLSVSVRNMEAKLSSLIVGNPKGFEAKQLLETGNITLTLESVDRNLVVINSIVVEGMNIVYETGTAGSNFDRVRDNTRNATTTDVKSPDVVIRKLKIVGPRLIPAVQGLSSGPVGMPDIVINNIGSEKNPATPAQVAAQVMNRVILTSSVGVVKATLKGAAVQTLEGVEGGLQELKGILSK